MYSFFELLAVAFEFAILLLHFMCQLFPGFLLNDFPQMVEIIFRLACNRFRQVSHGPQRVPSILARRFDHLIEEDLKQAVVVISGFVYNTAQRDEMLPRKKLKEPTAVGSH